MSAAVEAAVIFEHIRDATDREEILEALNGVSWAAFAELDERPGQFDPDYRQHDWHRLMRIERNDPASPLLDNLRRRHDR